MQNIMGIMCMHLVPNMVRHRGLLYYTQGNFLGCYTNWTTNASEANSGLSSEGNIVAILFLLVRFFFPKPSSIRSS